MQINIPGEATWKTGPGNSALLHQEVTREMFATNDVVINEMPTGIGKTKAALSYLRDLQDKFPSVQQYSPLDDAITTVAKYFAVIIVTPINALVSQAFTDVVDYVTNTHISYNCFPINHWTLLELKRTLAKDHVAYRDNGELLETLFSNPVHIISHIESTNRDFQALRGNIKAGRPFIYIINPDILYYAFFDVYYRRFQNNIHLAFFQHVKYVIFDEFHYYDLFQLTTFFTLLATWKIKCAFNDAPDAVKICLLSATPNLLVNRALKDVLCLRVARINDDLLTKNLGTYQKQFPHLQEIPFLAKVELHIHETYTKDITFERLVCSHETEIGTYLREGKYGLIICRAKVQADRIFAHFNATYLGKCRRITGGISQEDRDAAVEAPILITTNTVDLGFNFKRATDNGRQNIDFLFVDFTTRDEFIQRLGRGGRILGKPVTSEVTIAHIFLDRVVCDAINRKIASHPPLSSRKMMLSALTDLLLAKDYHEAFFKEYGFLPIKAFIAQLTQYGAGSLGAPRNELEQRIHQLEQFLREIYDVSAMVEIRRFEDLGSLHTAVKDKHPLERMNPRDLGTVVADYILNERNFNRMNPRETQSGHEETFHYLDHVFQKNGNPQTPEVLRNTHIKNFAAKARGNPSNFLRNHKIQLDVYCRYLETFFSNLAGNFRGGGFETTVEADDPGELAGSKRHSYDYFHYLKYYNYNILEDDDNYTLLQITSTRDYLEPYFEVEFEHLGKEEFEKGNSCRFGQRLWRLVYFHEGELGAMHTRPQVGIVVPQKIQRELCRPIVGYVLPSDEQGGWGMRKKYRLDFLKSFPLLVSFNHEGRHGTYQVFLGKDAFIAQATCNAVATRVIEGGNGDEKIRGGGIP